MSLTYYLQNDKQNHPQLGSLFISVSQILLLVFNPSPMMSELNKCFVKVLNAAEKTYASGVYKQVTVLQETGYWMDIFKVNVFPNHSIYNKLEKGLGLFMEVKSYSKQYRTLVNAEERLFKQCRECKRYHEDDVCICPENNAVRIQGNKNFNAMIFFYHSQYTYLENFLAIYLI